MNYFTVDFLGEITREPIYSDGSLVNPLSAPSPDRIHLFAMDQGTRVLDGKNNIVKLIEITESTELSELPSNKVLLGQVYDLQPSGVTFSKPASLTLGYDPTDVPEYTISVDIYYYDDIFGWTYLPSQADTIAEVGKIRAQVEHFSNFAVLATVQPAPTEQRTSLWWLILLILLALAGIIWWLSKRYILAKSNNNHENEP